MSDLAVVIVTWNVREIVLDALRTLYADLEQSGLDARVVVVDSASGDQTVEGVREQFPQTEVIASKDNLGFAGGNNAGLEYLGFGTDADEAALPRAVYLLNPDTLTDVGATNILFDTLFSDDRFGVVGPRLSYGDGSFQHAAFGFPDLRQLWVEFFPTPGRLIEGRFNGRYSQEQYQSRNTFSVDFMLGATMMLRREVIQETGMFDPEFFMYCEEIDWQWRIQKAGWRIACNPSAHVVHLGGQSTGQVKARSVINLWDSRIRLFRKHYTGWQFAIAKFMIRTGMKRKIRRGLQDGISDHIVRAYQTVWDMAKV